MGEKYINNYYAYVGGNPVRYVDRMGLAFGYSADAAPYVAQLRASSPLANSIMDAMAADPNTSYYMSVGPVPPTDGGGETQVLQPTQSLMDSVLGKPLPHSVVAMTVDPNSKTQFTATCGKKFTPSTLRLMGHELGHGYTYLLGGFNGYVGNYGAAVTYENAIASQIDPNAPQRAASDHGRFGP